MAEDARQTRVDDELAAEKTTSSRRRLLGQALGGACLLAAAGSGAFALRRVAAKDDDGDSGGPGSGGGSDDHSGHGGGGDDDHSGPGGGGDGDDVTITGEIPAGSIEVRIVDDDPGGFSPGELTVDLGAKVTFVNAHHDPHTATGPGFDTGILQPGDTATVELTKPGTYRYACQIHPEMTGTILVRDEDGKVPSATPAATPQSSPVAGGGEAETVAIRDSAFDPPELRVAVGTTVTWKTGTRFRTRRRRRTVSSIRIPSRRGLPPASSSTGSGPLPTSARSTRT